MFKTNIKTAFDNLKTSKRFSAFAIIEIVDVESKLYSYWLLRLSIAYFESVINVLVYLFIGTHICGGLPRGARPGAASAAARPRRTRISRAPSRAHRPQTFARR